MASTVRPIIVTNDLGRLLAFYTGLLGATEIVRFPDAGPVFLVPFVDAYVDRVDLSARRIAVDWQADY